MFRKFSQYAINWDKTQMLKKKSWNWTELNWGSYNVFIGKTTSRN